MPTVLMHTRPLDEKEKIVTGPRAAWLPPYFGDYQPLLNISKQVALTSQALLRQG